MKLHEHQRLVKLLDRVGSRRSIRDETAEHRLRELLDLAGKAAAHIQAPMLYREPARWPVALGGLLLGLALGAQL